MQDGSRTFDPRWVAITTTEETGPFFIPIVNIVIAPIVLNDLSDSFGKSVGLTLGLLVLSLIFFPNRQRCGRSVVTFLFQPGYPNLTPRRATEHDEAWTRSEQTNERAELAQTLAKSPNFA